MLELLCRIPVVCGWFLVGVCAIAVAYLNVKMVMLLWREYRYGDEDEADD